MTETLNAAPELDWIHRLGELTEHQARLVRLLDMVRNLRPSPPAGYCYSGKADFLLRHGQWFEKCPWTHADLERPIKQCFVNSVDLSLSHGFAYVEGEALRRDLPLSFHHGWNLDADGKLVDSTWRNDGDAYLGVVFKKRVALKALRNCGAVLDDYKSRWELFKKPWEG
jgi:hypothetical protein